MQLLKPFDGRRPHPKGHADGAGASSQDENNSADRKNLPSFIVSPLLPLPPSLFATRYDDHDNKMCGEGGCGCSLLLQRRRRHPALTIIETAPWFPRGENAFPPEIVHIERHGETGSKTITATCKLLSSFLACHACYRYCDCCRSIEPGTELEIDSGCTWKNSVLLGWHCSMKSCRQFRNLRLMNRARLSLPPLTSHISARITGSVSARRRAGDFRV